MTTISMQEFLILFILLLGNAFWIYILIKIASTEKGCTQKNWIIFVLLTHVIGASIYFTATRIKYLKGVKND